jgi:hypothetical protein
MTSTEHPPGDYAIVELFGHTTLVGRIAEIERFGTKMLALEPIFRGELLPAVLHGGTAIYRLTRCSAETAFSECPRQPYQLPPAIRVTVPPLLLDAVWPVDDQDAASKEEEMPF